MKLVLTLRCLKLKNSRRFLNAVGIEYQATINKDPIVELQEQELEQEEIP